MIWLTWRQFRVQALIGVGVAACLAAYLVVLGRQIRESYDTAVNCGGVGCTLDAARDTLDNDYFTTLLLCGFLIVLAPALIGAFWGAPLVARELETGTHRLVWNQGVTRGRWLAVKLGLVTLAGVVLTGTLSTLLTWAASPYDKLIGGRFDPLIFPTRNIAPLGYAVFAVVAGTTIGLLTRRTVTTMALTLATFAALQILLPAAIRPHLEPAVTETVAYNASAAIEGARINIKDGVAKIEGYAKPGAWVLSASTELLDAAGKPLNGSVIARCSTGDRNRDDACYIAQQAQFMVKYQPADRYWTFQWLELAIYLLLAAAMAAFAFWRIPRGLN
jgi:hypothetical protein